MSQMGLKPTFDGRPVVADLVERGADRDELRLRLFGCELIGGYLLIVFGKEVAQVP